MWYAIALALVAVLVATTNLLLTVGVIRRLREHTAQLDQLRDPTMEMPQPGTRVGAFEARTVDGRVLTLDSLGDEAMVAFLSPGCEACEESLPGFVAHIRASGRQEDYVTVVISAGEAAEGERMAGQFRGLANVVVEPPQHRELRLAFGVTAFPTIVTVSGGAIESVLDPMRLPAASPVLVG